MSNQLSRRELLAAGAASLAANAAPPEPRTICAFSKHFQWTDVAGLAAVCAELGYQGIDLTVRKGGHVEPERVADDLPKAAEIIRKAGLRFPMATTDIVDAQSPHAEAIVKTMASLGIRRYRWGGLRYNVAQSLPEQLAGFKPRVKDLAAMNQHYGVCAMYHTHSGVGQVGASMWDLYLLLKDFPTDAVAVNFDIGHAVVEGGYGGWIHSTRLLLPYMRGIAVKDFLWKQNARGAWAPLWRPLGQGMVNFKQFFPMVSGFSGPIQLHMEYPELGGAENGKREFSVPKDKLLALMRADVDTLKALLRQAGLA